MADVDDEEMIKSVRQKETEDSNYFPIIISLPLPTLTI